MNYTLKENGKYLCATFETLGDFVSQSEIVRPGRLHDSSRSQDGGWAGTRTFAEAPKLAREGWPEGREKLVKAMAEADSRPSQQPALMMDVAGAYPIAALAAAGDPCSMVDLAPVEDRVRPIIRLIVCRSGSAAYGADEFLNYGAAVLSYIEGLENFGFRVEITVSFACTMDGQKQVDTRVIVKKAEEHFEIDKLAFSLASPAFFRRLGFGVWESIPEIDTILGWGYGTPRNLDEKEAEDGQIILPGVNMVAPGDKSLKSPAAALAKIGPMIEAQLRNAGMVAPPLAFAAPNKGEA